MSDIQAFCLSVHAFSAKFTPGRIVARSGLLNKKQYETSLKMQRNRTDESVGQFILNALSKVITKNWNNVV